MLRDQELKDIYDGHFYTSDDMVMVGCHDCRGCSDCCRQTGDTIILDPYDMYMLSKGTGKVFTDMIEKEIEIRLVDGLILPNLMQHHEESSSAEDDSEDHCPFLSAAGRCTIHAYRPGFCRLFPLGRYYEGDDFRYILQKDECSLPDRYPLRVRDWLEIPDLEAYEDFVRVWHSFCRKAGNAAGRLTERSRNSVMRYVLQVFYVEPYRTAADFRPQFDRRMQVCRKALSSILPE